MIQQLKTRFDADDRAVSPVIGVILMVAITVILAAVIASLTLGLGDSAQTAPTAKFDFEQETVSYDDGSNSYDLKTVSISHQSGASIDEGRLKLVVNGDTAYDIDSSGNVAGLLTNSGQDATAGSSYEIQLSSSSSISGAVSVTTDGSGDPNGVDKGTPLSSDDTIKLVWTSEDGGTSSTLATYTVQ
ncbi:type IV pilin [Halomarina oriensis]|uniref:Type IV pilin n=1 Tax=Halomarina oriensis TaxID=671145 RepID=A0A6B0GDR4_9EURY|nr:type IV pilin N-terminal domain-containing protein [Halomarina oriensis]MWG32942.1 type IV pilin [Halomarina oriensis]